MRSIPRNIWILILLYSVAFSFADGRILTRDHVYQAQEPDNEMSCRVIARAQVKMSLLEDLGTYLGDETEVKNLRLTHADIVAVASGIVSMEILEERWNGTECYVRANLPADHRKIVNAFDVISQDRRKIRELIGIRGKAENLLTQIKRNIQPQKKANSQTDIKIKTTDYSVLIKELLSIAWFEQGYSLEVSRNYRGAMNAFSIALETHPHFAEAYYHRGYASMMLGEFPQSVRDYESATTLDPENERAHYDCGRVHAKLGNWQEAIRHFDKVIILNAESEMAFFHRGIAHAHTGNYYQALRDCDMALDLILLKECHWTGN
jgi:tetratricopeptide (TPR) repeat protein